jgi:glutamine amidotransferase
MCRIAALIGTPRPLATLLFEPPHSLEVQAYRPRSMFSGTVNVDGTGIVWWPERGAGEPLRYVSERTPWSDGNLASLAPRLTGAVQLAAVRSATPGMPFGDAAVGPFAADGLGFAHNGYVKDFERAVARPLVDALPDDLFARTAVRTDSTVLFALVCLARREDPRGGPARWLATAVDRVADRARAAGVAANLTCILSDGRELAACRIAVGLEPNTLHLCSEADLLRVASEPLDDGPWRSLAAGEVVELTTEGHLDPPRPETVP